MAEGTGIDMEEGNATQRELPTKPPAVVLALEDSGDAKIWSLKGSFVYSSACMI